ncbi:MAG: c-type cytochrome, partial [Chloroflexota bacterium]
LMPSLDYQFMNDTDMGRLIGYIQSLEPVDNDPGEVRPGPIGRIIILDSSSGFVAAQQIDHASIEPMNDVEVAVSVEYGQYVSYTCTGCHSANFTGGPFPGAAPGDPPPSNLTPHESGLADYTLEDFTGVIRNGIKPDGSVIDPQFMPWNSLGQMTDTEIEALYLYLQSLDPLPYNS